MAFDVKVVLEPYPLLVIIAICLAASNAAAFVSATGRDHRLSRHQEARMKGLKLYRVSSLCFLGCSQLAVVFLRAAKHSWGADLLIDVQQLTASISWLLSMVGVALGDSVDCALMRPINFQHCP
jgi:hypothetical protein